MKKFVFALVLVIFACSINKNIKSINFENRIDKWQNFVLKGVIKVNYKQFQFIKNIKLKKTPEVFKLAIYEGGIFGANAKSIISVKIDSVFTIKGSLIKNIPVKNLSINDMNKIFEEIKSDKNRIIKTRVYQKNKVKVYFNRQFDISIIVYKEFSLDFNYLGSLKSLEFYKKNKLLFRIDVDNISFGESND